MSLDLLSDHFDCDFWMPENRHGLAGRTVLLRWRICREISSIMWIPVINLIITECRAVTRIWKLSNPSQFKSSSAQFDTDLSTKSTNLLRCAGPKESSRPSLLYFYICHRELHMQSSPRPQGLEVKYIYLCLFFALPNQLSREKVRDESSKVFS